MGDTLAIVIVTATEEAGEEGSGTTTERAGEGRGETGTRRETERPTTTHIRNATATDTGELTGVEK